ncbi:MBL fold metallo-hydrolase [Paracoccus sp. (in: a-proteobacteria)]|uniref:MBL fold metallo-hydrolase n=1 Tax=Paracoccus sp. TaxID=267 RepID=UPI002898E6E1|nr:MBL fold metallo-hydrolase [Paracoccus sp. (in: a-proteobacteria)]
MKTTCHVSRRGALSMGATLPLAGLLPLSAGAQAAPTPGPVQAAPSAKILLGQIEVTPVRAGSGIAEKPIDTFALGIDPAEFARVAQDNFLPIDKSGSSYTPVLVRTGAALALVDTGLKPDETLAALAANGISAEQITHVILTHMHGDHIGGLMGEGPSFPNAELIVPKLENDYWATQDSEAYKAKVAPLIGKARQISDGDEVLPGIHAEAAYGHTPGHTTYLLKSDDQQLLLSGDSFNHYAFSVSHPEWKVRFDIDKEMGIATRKRVLARLAEERLPFIGYHMPFPAMGYIAKAGDDSYRYVPVTYQFAV